MNENSNRAPEFRRNAEEEALINEINEILSCREDNVKKTPQMPVFLVMGSARSGSTLLTQYLADTGLFSYPSNLIARFPANPRMGRLIQELFQHLTFLNQNESISYVSNLGKTQGALAPNEFWYLWRRHLNFDAYGRLDAESRTMEKGLSFLNGLAGLEKNNAPVVMKGMIANQEIEFLHGLFPKFIFVHTRKKLAENAFSILKARQKYFQDRSKWYSFRPPECADTAGWNPYQEVVAQVYFTHKELERAFKALPEANKIEVFYDDFCNNPYSTLKELVSRAEEFDCKPDYNRVSERIEFKTSQGLKNASKADIKGINEAIEWIEQYSKEQRR